MSNGQMYAKRLMSDPNLGVEPYLCEGQLYPVTWVLGGRFGCAVDGKEIARDIDSPSWQLVYLINGVELPVGDL